MRKIIAAGILGLSALAAGAPARAADMALKAPPPPPCDWCGFYAGVNLGVDWSHSSISPYFNLPFPAFANFIPGIGVFLVPGQFGQFLPTSGNATSVIGGGQAGYNWVNGHVLYGLEADIDGTGLRAKSATTLSRRFLPGTQTVTANFSVNVNWIATVRGRLGYVADRSLYYVTGGFAAAGTQLNTAYAIVDPAPPLFPPTPLTASDSHVIGGWTAGIGGEWMFDRKWSGALEYRHTGFGAHGYNIGFTDASLVGFSAAGNAAVRFSEDQVTARLNYHFH
jgi:outer membrane immunogenic protein